MTLLVLSTWDHTSRVKAVTFCYRTGVGEKDDRVAFNVLQNRTQESQLADFVAVGRELGGDECDGSAIAFTANFQ